MKVLLSSSFVEYLSFHFPDRFHHLQEHYSWNFCSDLGWEIDGISNIDENFLENINAEFLIDQKYETQY